MKYFYTISADGFQLFDSDAKVPKGWTQVPRMPEDFEHFDEATGAFVKNIAGLEQAYRDKATREILTIWPAHKQINDTLDPTREGAAERIAAVKIIRDQCNARIDELKMKE